MIENKIKILLVVRWPVGGIRTYLRYVYNCFDPSKYTITLIAPDLPEVSVLLNDLSRHDIIFLPLDENPSNYVFIKLILNTLGKSDFDIIHSHGLTAGLCSIIPSLLHHVPHLLTIHDVFTSKQFQGIKGYAKKALISIAIPLIDKIHTVSNDAKQNLLHHVFTSKIFKNKIVAIINGIEISRFMKEEAIDIRSELQLAENSFLIGFFGRFMSQKGFVYLIEALSLIYYKNNLNRKPVVLTFGEGAFIREEKSFVKEKGLRDVVFFLPFTPNIAPVLKSVDLVVMPSLWEACGLLAMEAMVAGVPLIGTNCIGLREVLEGSPCEMIPIKDSKTLATEIEREMSCPTKPAAKHYSIEAARRFDVSIHSKKIESLILSLIDVRRV
ncbi:glycosyltransferase family 4 protein [Oryzomonas rubra]|uniref:Glycosyltransferase family 1 protein n=1 Tax=Oryzomonas rubra TaxID=2509454 RepID=A0A5A9XDS2_9BACT|nr:glycosyltransferase family 4 protein [Oryzomonas rubra]KAA0890508.1 glycosyltransferase family 1 protein [Oryzomonas rubra]